LCAVLLLATLQAQSAKAATAAATAVADNTPLRLGVGLFQPDKEKNDATYRPLADHLAKKLGRKVELRTVSSWEGLAKSLANGETDIGLLGPWGYVLANQASGAQAVATILYEGKTFAFGDKGSTSGYLIPRHYFMTLGIVPETYFSKVLYTSHQAIETQVSRGVIDAGADYNRNRNAMIEQGLITADQSKIIWRSAPLPNDAVAVSAALYNDKAFVALLQAALVDIGPALAAQPNLLPAHYTGFVARDNLFYKPIRDAGLATGTLTVK
jgi:phosphonate transport system substrate-binding protein